MKRLQVKEGCISHKIRLTKLERIGAGNTLWAFIGIGRSKAPQDQQLLEMQYRESYYSSGGNKSADLSKENIKLRCFDSSPLP